MRNYIIYQDLEQNPSLTPLFDTCVTAILEGTMRVSKTKMEADYPIYDCFRVEGKELLCGAVLEYYLYSLGSKGFSYTLAHNFTEVMRLLWGWQYKIDSVLRDWAKRVICLPFFTNTSSSEYSPTWELKPGEPSWQLPDDYIQFACYIAICLVKYGASYESLAANEIFKQVEMLGSSLPAKLKKEGSGSLPKELVNHKEAILSCKANDVFATISIRLKEESEYSYQVALDFLIRLLEADFPKTYSISFQSPCKNWLPIAKLPKKGVHQLFANAVQYTSLHERIARYAKLAMKEYEWYDNLENDDCAMPGTFAVFALGMLGDKYHNLVCSYLDTCDGEHQSLQGEFVLAYIKKYGFTYKGQELYDHCDANIQHLPKQLLKLHEQKSKN